MKFSLSILLLFLLFLFIDMTSISFKYANKDILSFDLDNIRNKKLKKITNFFDQYYENFLAKNFYKHNSYYNPKISEELSEKGINKTGTYNMGGVTGTEAGILFATGTIDKKIRVFDSSNGKEVWSYKMSYIGSSPPTTYLYNNEQFVIVAVTGSTSLSIAYPKKVEVGNKIYAFKIN